MACIIQPAIAAHLLLAFALAVSGRQPLTFEEREKAQNAIEGVYYAHRVWPKENPGPKPAFEQVITGATLQSKALDSLRKSAALEALWQRPIAPAQLQAEMDRMARDTKDPALLSELFAALNNDPTLVAECLARPLLADRLIRNWYANDERFHGEARAAAESARNELTADNFETLNAGRYSRRRYVLTSSDQAAPTYPTLPGRQPGEDRLAPEEWEKLKKSLPLDGNPGPVQEDAGGFFILRRCGQSDESLDVECRYFSKVPFDSWWEKNSSRFPVAGDGVQPLSQDYYLPPIASPDAASCAGYWEPSALENAVDGRQYHTAVWTGTEMIVWGGAAGSSLCYETGSRYSPATDTWRPTPTGPNCPEGRIGHTAIWTGSEMVVWGGAGSDGSSFADGGRYNPSTDEWNAIQSGPDTPEARSSHTAIWTGTEMIVWGGDHQVGPSHTILNTGGRYNPVTGSWRPTSTGTNAPGYSSTHVAVWTGSMMVVWGNYWPSGLIGGRYNPVSDSWLPVSQGPNCPTARLHETAVWTGKEMIIWGGDWWSTNPGGRYDPVSDTWSPTSTGANCPSGRQGHTAVWTGTEMIVWGANYYTGNTGGRYNPLTDSWRPTATGGACPSERYGHTAVWTGSEMIVWGGYVLSSPIPAPANTGGRYRPSSDDWVPTSTGALGRPDQPYDPKLVWTGAELLVTGLTWNRWAFPISARYSLATDSWSAMSAIPDSPNGREGQYVFWTGSDMLLWGGDGPDAGFGKQGYRYHPVSDTWTPISTAPPCPTYSLASGYRVTWTGSDMVVWGWDGDVNGGRGARYSLSSDSWAPMAAPGDLVPPRDDFSMIWSGGEVVLWGGRALDPAGPTLFNTGGRYSPTADTWRATAVSAETPTPRMYHSVLSTGAEMIIWGGDSAGQPVPEATGGRYDPVLDRWQATSTGSGCPLGRVLHSAVWTGREMIVWGGESYPASRPWLGSGARYDPETDVWTPMVDQPHTPSARCFHAAVWAGTRMIVLAGYPWTSTGGIYVPELATPAITGPERGCEVLSLSTSWYPSYQWNLNGAVIPGATERTLAATQSGTYSVTVTDGSSCSATSAGKMVTIAPPPTATVSGPRFNRCPTSEVALTAAPSGMAYQWNYSGRPIAGATAQTYGVSLSGDYAVTVTNDVGCSGTSAPLSVFVLPCPTTEVSPTGAVFPARLVKDSSSATGYYLYFQKVLRPQGYNLYEGTIGAWYSHGSGPGKICGLAATDLGNGEMRTAITPSDGNHYYLVTTFQKGGEGPSGFDSEGAQIPPSLSTCPP